MELLPFVILHVGLEVSAVVISGKELFVARSTLVGLFTSVDLLVSLEVGDLDGIRRL